MTNNKQKTVSLFHLFIFYALAFSPNITNTKAPDLTRTMRSGTIYSTLVTVLSAAKIPAVLDNPLYKKTHPVQFRNITQLPAFLSSTTKKIKEGWHFDFFLNRSFTKDYTDSSSTPKKVSAYLNLEDDTILNAFEDTKNIVVTNINNFDTFSIPDLFNVFSPMKLQEHRIGIMNRYHKQWGNITVDIKLPLLWAERNFNFTSEEKEKLYTNELLARFDAIDEWELAKKYMISDQLGFGTLEATFSADLIKNYAGGLQAGVTLYFPTEVALKKGLLGTYRELTDDHPKLDFCEIFILASGSTLQGVSGWQDKISDYFVKAFTRFTSNLLYVPLGFDHHPGIAVHISPTWHMNHRWTWKSNYSINILLPTYQNRLMVDTIKSETEATDTYKGLGSPDGKVKLIEELISERIFPRLSKSLIMPGAIFNSTSCFHYTRGNTIFSFGYNSWIQLREQIFSHSLNPKVVWNIAAAEKPYAAQVKLFGKIEKTIQRESHDLSISLYLDCTTFDSSLGNDFLINFEIKGKF